jgi:hypothetical protein
MLFTKFLLALPLFASAGFAAPAKTTEDLVDRATTVDPLSILNNLKSTVAVSAAYILSCFLRWNPLYPLVSFALAQTADAICQTTAAGITPTTSPVDVTANLTDLVNALDTASANLSAGVSLGGLSSTLNGVGSTVSGLLGSLSGR